MPIPAYAVVVHNGTIYATIQRMLELREYRDHGGGSPFRKWFDRLNAEAAGKVTTALYRIGLGNFSNTKSVGGGVYEHRINFGPGYRVYFAKDGEQIVVLIGGGTKQRQEHDIRWTDGRTTKGGKGSRKANEDGFDQRF